MMGRYLIDMHACRSFNAIYEKTFLELRLFRKGFQGMRSEKIVRKEYVTMEDLCL